MANAMCTPGDSACVMPATASASPAPAPTVSPRLPAPAVRPAPPPATPADCAHTELTLQRYLCQTADQFLPVYGLDLFSRDAQNGFGAEAVAVPADYLLGVNDTFNVRIWGQLESDLTLTVDRTGAIFIPRVGAIHVVGVPFGSLKGHLDAAIGNVFHDYDLAVSMGELKQQNVFVVGFVRHPGSVSVSSLSTIVNALYAAGGPSANGSLRQVQLKRGGVVVRTLDLYQLLLRGDKRGDVMLQAGDVIHVPPAGAQVALLGAVRQPGIYEALPNESLQALLDMAGGTASEVLDQPVSVERIVAQQHRVIQNVPLPQLAGYALKAGDIVRFYHLSGQVGQSVALRGNVAQPVRRAWTEGMRVSDLITSRDMLLDPAFWLRRDPPAQLAATDAGTVRRNLTAAADEINWHYATIERLDPKTLTRKLLPFDLAQAIDHAPDADLPLQADDIVHVFSRADIEVRSDDKSRYVRLEGEVAVPGIYEVQPGETLRDLVARIGGLGPQGWLYAAEFTRPSIQQQQQRELDRMLDELHAQNQRQSAEQAAAPSPDNANAAADARMQQQANEQMLRRLATQKATGRIVLGVSAEATAVTALPGLPLEDGDRFYVPPRPSTIAVVGEVYNRHGAFAFDQGKQIGDYLDLAGGATGHADTGQMYVVRADGSVVSAAQRRWPGKLGSLIARPGDTLIVPTQLIQPSGMRVALDWSRILANFALGAVAIKVLGD
ncbi:SLBB domain-containing protein [Amantichitinum ursilacus]|nr:SLBB domain-containing protein [Amantichitinum ursilacus]